MPLERKGNGSSVGLMHVKCDQDMDEGDRGCILFSFSYFFCLTPSTPSFELGTLTTNEQLCNHCMVWTYKYLWVTSTAPTKIGTGMYVCML